MSILLDDMKEMGKMTPIDNHCFASISGLTADANYLIGNARKSAQQHLYTYKNPMPVEQVVQSICEQKHQQTQYGSYRPYGVSFMYAGWDKIHGYQLYCSDPSGNYAGWKAHATGMNNVNAITILKSDYEEDISLQNALKLAVKVVQKTIDTHDPKFEIWYLTKEEHGLVQKELAPEEIKKFLEEIKAEAENEDKES